MRSALTQDLRFAFRHFRRTPITTITMVLVLAIGIGVNSALFIVLSFNLSHPPAGVSRDKSLVRIRTLQQWSRSHPGLSHRDASVPELGDYAARTDLFDAVVGTSFADAVLDGVHDGSGPIAIPVEFVTPGYFATLGVPAAVGPGLPPARIDEPSPDPVVVISDPLWSERFAGAADAIGKTLHLNGVSLTVVGVAPSSFRGVGEGTTLWMPLSLRQRILGSNASAVSSRDSLLLVLFARLRPGVTAEGATPIVRTIAHRSNDMMATGLRSFVGTADVVPVRVGNGSPDREAGERLTKFVFSGITLLVLIITCLNVSALLAGSAVSRSGEIAVRLALGASRGRIIRQLLTENAIVAACGGALGLLVLSWIVAATLVTTAAGELTVGWDSALFTLAVAMGTTLLFGLSPALHATRVSVSETMKRSATSSGTSRSRLQRAFVVAQIALIQPLLVVLAIFLGDAVHRMSEDAVGAIGRHVIVADLVRVSGRGENATNIAQRELEERFRGVPGVIGVVRTDDRYGVDRLSVHPADRGVGATDTKMNARLDHVAPGYFALMDIAFVRGRDFTAADQRDETAVIVGSDLARALWGAADPIGKRLQSWHWGAVSAVGGSQSDFYPVSASTASDTPRNMTIVGVVDAAKLGWRFDLNQIRVFVPGKGGSAMLIRTQGSGEALVPVLRSIANREFPELPLDHLETLTQQSAAAHRQHLNVTAFAVGTGMLILLLASVGLYAVVAFAVGQRTREIGIRMALGAAPTTVVAMFLRSGAALGGIGLAIGLPLSVAAMQILSHTAGLPRVNTAGITGAIALIVILVSLLATWLPSRRAARVDPLIALRAE
ncbi:MAG: ABC transporter permease [bacterium]